MFDKYFILFLEFIDTGLDKLINKSINKLKFSKNKKRKR